MEQIINKNLLDGRLRLHSVTIDMFKPDILTFPGTRHLHVILLRHRKAFV